MPFKDEERIFPRNYENRIFCEDCLTFMKGTPDGSVPLILTDPPYGIHYSNRFAKNPHTMSSGDDGIDYPAFARESYRILRMNNHAYFFTRFDCYPYHFQYLQEAGFVIKSCLVIEKGTLGGIDDLKGNYASSAGWVILCQKGRRIFNSTTFLENRNEGGTMFHKGRQSSKRHKTRLSDCWSGSGYPKATHHSMWRKKNGIFHPTVKNEVCLQQLIRISSNPGDLVFDGFMGTGNTALATVQSGRKFTGTEISEEYWKIAQDRIRKAGKEMVLDEG